MIFFHFTKKEEDYKKNKVQHDFFLYKTKKISTVIAKLSHKIAATNEVILGSHGRGPWNLEPGALHFWGGEPKVAICDNNTALIII